MDHAPGVPVSAPGTVVEFDLVGINQSFASTADISQTFQVNQLIVNVCGLVGPLVAAASRSQPIALVANGTNPPTVLQINTGSIGFTAAFASGTVLTGGGTCSLNASIISALSVILTPGNK
jgi:hypothetical protein